MLPWWPRSKTGHYYVLSMEAQRASRCRFDIEKILDGLSFEGCVHNRRGVASRYCYCIPPAYNHALILS